MDRLFFRALVSAFGFRPFDRRREVLVPYFQYKIGGFSTDYYLHFLREPEWNLYRYEIFEKLKEYSGDGIARYLDFHFKAYTDKGDLLRFLRYETEDRLRRLGKRMKKDRNKLEMVLLWVSEQEGILKPAAVGSPDVPPIASEPVEGAELRSPEIESTVHDLLKSYSGKIVVNGKHHLERFIQLLILVKDLYDPGKPDNPLFTQFSTNDLAAVLRQIKELRELQVNTLQKKISDCGGNVRHNDPRTAQLVAALTEFFYGQAVR